MDNFQTSISGSSLDMTGQPVEFYETHNVSSTVNEVEIIANNKPAQNQVTDFDWNRFRLWTVDDVFKPRPKKLSLIEGLINEKEIAIFFGKYGQKKSFAAISLAIHVAAGKPWIGLKTIKSPVIYINEDSR